MQRLKELRNEANLSLRDLAQILDMSYSSLGKYERGDQQPTFETLIKIADYFNVPLDYLIGRSDCKNPQNQEIATALHLTESAIEFLKKLNRLENTSTNQSLSDILSCIITHPSFFDILKKLLAFSSQSEADWQNFGTNLYNSLSQKLVIESESKTLFNADMMKDAIIGQLSIDFKDIIKSFIK